MSQNDEIGTMKMKFQKSKNKFQVNFNISATFQITQVYLFNFNDITDSHKVFSSIY